jgi:hypothetical protein
VFEIIKIICVIMSAAVVFNSVFPHIVARNNVYGTTLGTGQINAHAGWRGSKRLRNKYSFALAFVVFAIWLRLALSAFPNLTHDAIFAGFSINALASIFVVVVGLMYLPLKAFLLKKLSTFYIFMSAIIISGVINLTSVDLLNVIIKWAYLLVLSLALMLAIRRHKLKNTLRVLITAFYLPIALVILSILLGETKATEQDGSVSYIGGYSHESGVSMIVISFALIVSLLDRTHLPNRNLLFYSSVVLLVLVNYRTGMLAMLPIVIAFILASTYHKILPKFRLVSLLSIGLCVGLLLYLSSLSMSARFQDIAIVLTNWDELLKAPDYFSQAERRLFSWFAIRIRLTHIRIKMIGALLGFLVMNLATMPLWNIEGLILFSIIFGVAMAGYTSSRAGLIKNEYHVHLPKQHERVSS